MAVDFKKHKKFFFIPGILMFLFIQIIFPMPGPMLYIYFFVVAFFILSHLGVGWSLKPACLLFLGATIISILGNDIPAFFKPWERFFLFFLMFIGCSPMVNGPEVNRVRRQIFMGSLWALVAITAWIFIGYFTGQGLYIWGFVNGYMGVTGHPNFLSFFVMMSMVWVAQLFFRCTTQKERIICAGFWVACLITILLSASRSATACGLIGTIMVIYLRLQKNAGGIMTVAVVFVIAVIVAWPVLAPYTEAMSKKTSDNADAAIAASRGYIWELRQMEIEESPVIGIGAYACDTKLPSANVFYNEKTGAIELGSSYLGMMSQIGYLGFICFLLVTVPLVLKVRRYAMKERTPYAQLIFSMIVPAAINMAFEGYAMTAGAVQCVFVWLLFGAADQVDTVADYPITWEKWDPPTPEQYVQWRDQQTDKKL